MAKTNTGIEFYIAEVTPTGDGAQVEEIEEALRKAVRNGDAVFQFEGRLYIALAADLRGAAQALRRLLKVIRDKALGARMRMAQEPFAENLWNVAARIVTGEVAVSHRMSSEDEQSGRSS